ncbi:MAG: glycosyltransferase family 2 protein [Bacteroidota bacterium]
MRSHLPATSVVIPTFNRSALVTRAIDSVLSQTHPAAEIIVVDDGSTDDTPAVIQKFGERVRYLRQEQGGASKARNHGVAEASSDWIAFLDSDDVWVEDYLRRMLHAVSGTKGQAWVYFGDAAFGDDPESPTLWDQAGYTIEGDYHLLEDAGDLVMQDVQPMLLQFSVFNREIYLLHGGLWQNLRAAEDTHLFMKLGLQGSVCAVSGSGGVAMQDENPSNRLTKIYGSASSDHWKQVIMMCQDVLRSVQDLRPSHRKILHHRIADAHWRQARLAWVSRRFGGGLREMADAVRVEPMMIPAKAWGALRGMWHGGRHN